MAEIGGSKPLPPTARAAADYSPARAMRARTVRRVLLAILIAFIAAGASNAFGVRRKTVSATGGGYTMTLTYGSVSRSGLSTPWDLTITRPGGFSGPVRVGTTASYFDVWDANGTDPEPSSSTTSGDMVVWEFDPPDGETLSIGLDSRIQPAYLGSRSARTVLFDGGREVAAVTYRTKIWP